MEARLNAYLKQDRQWRRPHRIAYARLMLKYAWALPEETTQKGEVAFWRSVIKANEYDTLDKSLRRARREIEIQSREIPLPA
jgi:hypothetical protein